jgi:hypothetical protein
MDSVALYQKIRCYTDFIKDLDDEIKKEKTWKQTNKYLLVFAQEPKTIIAIGKNRVRNAKVAHTLGTIWNTQKVIGTTSGTVTTLK